MDPDSTTSAKQKFPALGYFAIIVISLLLALMLVPGDWYLGANKPVWAPAGGFLSILWAGSCMLLALTAWQIQHSIGFTGRWVIFNFVLAILMYWAWWWLFFGLHRIGWSIAVQTLAVLVTATLLLPGHRSKSFGRWLLLLWAGYLWLLNYSVWVLNGGGFGGGRGL